MTIYPTANNKKDDMTGDLNADGKGPDGGAEAFEQSRKKVLGDLKEVIAHLVREGLLEQQQTVPPPRRKGQVNPNQEPLDLPGLRSLLGRDIRTLGVGERNRVINFLRDITTEQLGEYFKQMTPAEVQQMEYVVNSSVSDNKIGPFFNKIEIAHGIAHLANLQKQKQQPQQQTQPPGQKKVSTQKMALPKQELSQQFQGKVQQYFNQIKQAPGLNPQQREKLIAQLGRIQFAPEGNEQSKLRQIQDFVRSNLGKERVDIGAQPQQQQQASSPWAPSKPGQQQQKSGGGGVLGKVKGMFGLNEDFRTLMLEDL